MFNYSAVGNMPFDVEEELTLGKEQEEALGKIKQFLHSESSCFSIYGSAGSGKTYLTKAIIRYLNSQGIKYCLCAPTHKAALVIERFTDKKALTLHSLLALSPKLDVLKLNFRELEFNSGDCKEIPQDGVVLCDEASMINDDLFDFLLKRCKELNAKTIFVSDAKQIQPVKQKTKSKVYSVEDHFELTKIYRQADDSALKDILINLREAPIHHFENAISDKGSLYCMDSLKTFVQTAISLYKKAINSKDILQTKILAYTNKRVAEYNNCIHRNLFKSNAQYNQYEFLTCYCNITRQSFSYWNSMDYIITQQPEQIDFEIPELGLVPGYNLTLYDSLAKSESSIHIIDKKYPYFNKLAAIIEVLRLEAIEEKSSFRKREAWKKYFKTMDAFTTPIDLVFDGRVVCKKSFDYGYATSVHRSQGSTINNVFVDMQDIFKQKNPEELRQLQYVALSRTAHNCYLYT